MCRKACHLRPRNRLFRESTGGCIARELPVFHNKLAVASQLRHSEQGNNVGMNNNDDRKFEHISDPYRRLDPQQPPHDNQYAQPPVQGPTPGPQQPPAGYSQAPNQGFDQAQQPVNHQTSEMPGMGAQTSAASTAGPTAPGPTAAGSAAGPTAPEATAAGAGVGAAVGAASISGPQGTAVAEALKEKRTVSLGTALALMLVGALGAGAITGVAVGQPWKNSSGSVVNALSEPAVHRTATDKEGSVEQVAENVLPAVVSIRVSNGYSVEEGSGSIISDDGNILTNNHVVSSAQQGGEITVLLNDGKEYKADFVAGDGSTDIAVIKLRNASNLPVMSFGNSDELQVGQQVVAIGSPLGLSATVTSGIISALNRPVRASGGEGGESSLIDAVQTDAAINPGNSGGPLVDMQGRLIGMNSVIATNSGDSGQSGSIGLGFAIPVNQARRIAQQLMDEGKVTQPMIGIRLSNNSRERGALVGDVEPDGPAQKAGITQGDLIVGVNDRVIDSADALITAIRARDFGETVTLKVTRPDSGDVRDVKVTLTEKK